MMDFIAEIIPFLNWVVVVITVAGVAAFTILRLARLASGDDKWHDELYSIANIVRAHDKDYEPCEVFDHKGRLNKTALRKRVTAALADQRRWNNRSDELAEQTNVKLKALAGDLRIKPQRGALSGE